MVSAVRAESVHMRKQGELRVKKGIVRKGAVAVSVVMTAGSLILGTSVAAHAAVSQPPLVVGANNGGLVADNFNPDAGGNNGTYGLLYEPLFYFNLAGPQVYPLLGKSYHWSDHDKVLTVVLRHNVRWSDGKPFTSNDVVYTFQLMKKYPSIDGYGLWNDLSSVTAHGAYTVDFNFRTVNVPDGYYILDHIYPVPEQVFKDVKNPTTFQNPHPVTDGPYTLLKFSPQAYFLKANPLYWGGVPKVQEVEFPSYNGNQSGDLALQAGQVDFATWFLPDIQKVWVSGDPTQRHYWYPSDAPFAMVPNIQNPLLKPLVVRRAISMAIDRQEIDHIAEYGYGPTAYPTGLSAAQAKVWTDPNLPAGSRNFVYSPSKAKELLLKAGYKMGADGVFNTPQGKPLSLNLICISGFTDNDESAEIIAQELDKIGIHVNVQELALGAWYGKASSGNFELTFNGAGGGPNPYYFYDAYLTKDGGADWNGWNNAQTNALLAEFSKTNNVAEQKRIMYKVEQIFTEQLPVMPIFGQPDWNDYQTSRFTGWPTAQDPYANIYQDAAAYAVIFMRLHPVK